MQRARWRRIARGLFRALVVALAIVLILIGAALATIETGWAKNRLRDLIVHQANQYLTATLEIGQLQGSLLRGIQLTDVRLSREGETIVSIDDITLNYSVRELVQPGVVIRKLRLVRPTVAAAKQPDGRWNLAALVRRQAQQRERRGPGRPIQILSIEVVDGAVALRDPLTFGAVRVPARYDSLNASLSFDYRPVESRLDFSHASWNGGPSDLTVNRLSGVIANGSSGWVFEDLTVATPQSAFVLTGRLDREHKPTTLDLRVKAERFAFQEWATVLRGLRNIAIEASFETRLKGPLAKLATDLNLHSNGGAVHGSLVLDTTVPGWHGRGVLNVNRLDISHWLNRPDRPTNVSGRVDLDMALELGRRIPRGSYVFRGPHAAFMEYQADDVRARGTITTDEVLIADATARAYGADVRVTNGSIGIDSPFPFRFAGTAARLDLRQVPETVPVPHVESTLAFDYDVTGRFASPFIIGNARFADSEFLGARVGDGSVGMLDTFAQPVRYSGEGDVYGLDIRRVGAGLEVAWMQDPRYAGNVSGRFRVDAIGGESASMELKGGGRLVHAELFGGTLSDADVTIEIGQGSLSASYNGRLSMVNPAIAMNDPRFAASLTGTGQGRVAVRDLLVRTPVLADYDIDATLALDDSTVRGIPLNRATVTAALAGGTLNLTGFRAEGPDLEAQGAGTIELEGQRSSQFDYDVVRADLSLVRDLLGREVAGEVATKGRLTGPTDALRLSGNGTVTRLDVGGVKALTTTMQYDVTIPSLDPARTAARINGTSSFIEGFNQRLQEATGTVTYADGRLTVDLKLVERQGVAGAIAGSVVLHPDERSLDLESLIVTLQRSAWRLSAAGQPPRVNWDEHGVVITPLLFVDAATGSQQIAISGTWRDDGNGGLRIVATRVFLDSFFVEQPARYGGVVDLDAIVRGTREHPIVTGQIAVASGRVRRLSYERLAGRVDYADGLLEVNVRLDQAPGTWLNAAGTVPLAVFNRELPERPVNVAIASSSIALGLLEGVTDVVRDVTGEMRLNVSVIGTSHDPHFDGTIELANAGFVVTSSGTRYRNGRGSLRLAQDRVTVDTLHLEDNNGQPLEVRGSLATHELRVGDLAIDVTARGFEVVRNEFGTVDVDANLSLRGQFERPRLEGRITVAGGALNIDSILDRALFQPYSTEAALVENVDAIAALNPWERLGLNIELHVPGTLRMTGDNVQVTPGTPLGLGSFNLRVIGDLYLYKDPGQPLYVTGSFDSVTGTYAFQGRRFEIDPASSINFRGDLNPEVYVTVGRVISGVVTRVTIAGPLREPELRLASTPPLDSSDILSLIVFNASTNQLTAEQQQELAVRAGTLAAGFLATPLVAALERSLGLDILEIEAPGELSTGPRVTIGDELAPGLVARFSRQFGQDEYDEATIEYYLARMLRIRATFSDAGTLITRSPFRRVERAGIDLLVFFSF